MDRIAELRIRVGAVEIAVVGTSREDCLRQLEQAAREVDAGEARYVLTPAGAAALDAAEAQEEAAHQAARDRDREPDRWPTGRAGR